MWVYNAGSTPATFFNDTIADGANPEAANQFFQKNAGGTYVQVVTGLP